MKQIIFLFAIVLISLKGFSQTKVAIDSQTREISIKPIIVNVKYPKDTEKQVPPDYEIHTFKDHFNYPGIYHGCTHERFLLNDVDYDVREPYYDGDDGESVSDNDYTESNSTFTGKDIMYIVLSILGIILGICILYYLFKVNTILKMILSEIGEYDDEYFKNNPQMPPQINYFHVNGSQATDAPVFSETISDDKVRDILSKIQKQSQNNGSNANNSHTIAPNNGL